ncbi:hypothetical protein [Methylobacterium brachiatum]|uniref:hypothetical protein n=1 Tax=Methylobacterium brachiatum TaxID=269660 RepID=UPI000EFC2D2F|nr:hypothetical protein [Methylobacterium brachiatum]AYO84056.1 hypothetical protein EBB05_18485 [Methylobacterium brachiatum]
MTTSSTNTARGPGLKLSPVNRAKFRRPDLKAWAAATEIIVRHDRAKGIPLAPEALREMTRLIVEHDRVMGRFFDVFGDARVDWLAALFGVSSNMVTPHWNEAVAESARYHELAYIAAHARLDREGEAQLGRHKLVAGSDISAAFNLTAERKNLIFPRVNGKRRRTRLPPYKAPGETTERPIVNKVPYTLAELRDWTRRLGFKADTISLNARKLTEDEFHARIAKRDAKTLPADQLAGRKLDGESDYHASVRIAGEAPPTRDRKPGITAARRAYAAAFGCCKRTAITRTGCMTADQILAAVVDRMARTVPACTDKTVPVCTDKRHQNLPFRSNFRSDHNDKGTACYTLRDTDLAYLVEYNRKALGRELKADTIKKWRQRGKLEARVYEACEWLSRQAGIEADLAEGSENVVTAMQEARRDRTRRVRIERELTAGPLVQIAKPAA